MSTRQPRKPGGTWVICSTCNGDGHHARRLGAFTMEEFNEAFDEEAAERYFRGDYDSECEDCDGTGKVLEAPADEESEEDRRFDREWANEQMWERRMLHGLDA